jgi:SAM-dependent methyltransferase
VNLDAWQKNWDALGKDDPLWVVLTDPTKKGGKWDPAEFFNTGRVEIDGVLADLAKLGTQVEKGRALDFGCGVGRLSQALAAHFAEVHGVDISPSMVGHANRFNRFPERCSFHINPHSDLRLFPADHFDFIYSNIVLQHIEPRFSKEYIREFVRVLKPGGVAVFQVLEARLLRALVPDAVVTLVRRIKFGKEAFIGMFGIPQGELAELLRQAGAVTLDKTSSPMGRWRSYRFVITKSA